MRKILNALLKFNSMGYKLYEGIDELIDDEKGTITTLKKETLSTCPNCGQPVDPEKNRVRSNCPLPLCNGLCCDFCHEERLRHEKITFERMIIVEREIRRWHDSGVFDGFPGIKLYRRIAGFNSMSRLKSMQRRLIKR